MLKPDWEADLGKELPTYRIREGKGHRPPTLEELQNIWGVGKETFGGPSKPTGDLVNVFSSPTPTRPTAGKVAQAMSPAKLATMPPGERPGMTQVFDPTGATAPSMARYAPKTTGKIAREEFGAQKGAVAGMAERAGMPGVSGMIGTITGQAGLARAEAAVRSFGIQKKVTEAQAQKAEMGLDIMRKATSAVGTKPPIEPGSPAISKGLIQSGNEDLNKIEADLLAGRERSGAAWERAVEKADDYVIATRQRTAEAMNRLDDMATEMGKNRDFAKAHDMQAAVQTMMGSMVGNEREILQRYGQGSAEHQQFLASKRTSLGTLQSNLHASYQRLAEQQDQVILQATNEAQLQSHMYENFQEQQHVKTLEAAANADALYSLQVTQGLISIDKLRMARDELRMQEENLRLQAVQVGTDQRRLWIAEKQQWLANQENLANWIIDTPEFVVDAAPFVNLIADIVTYRI